MPKLDLTRGSQVIGLVELAKIYGKSHRWARSLLREWWQEQEQGGEVRVFRRPHVGGWAYFTTKAVLQRHMPPARDMALVRSVERLDKDLDFLTTRLNREIQDRMLLEQRIEKLERRR